MFRDLNTDGPNAAGTCYRCNHADSHIGDAEDHVSAASLPSWMTLATRLKRTAIATAAALEFYLRTSVGEQLSHPARAT